MSSLPAFWVKHPGREADAAYKPAQLAIVYRCGLQVPRTIITNSPKAVHAFAQQIAGPMICKLLGASAFIEDHTPKIVYTARLTENDLTDLRGVETTAHLFQEYVTKKHEARIAVIGKTFLTVAIHANSTESEIDWRTDYDALQYEVIDPPERVQAGIMSFMRHFGLIFGAFDFVIRPDGQWVMLECNPAGQFGWLESAAGLPISETLATLLTKGTTKP